jgi:hypothetical protein
MDRQTALALMTLDFAPRAGGTYQCTIKMAVLWPVVESGGHVTIVELWSESQDETLSANRARQPLYFSNLINRHLATLCRAFCQERMKR